jgi:membrane fusion protein (multidrug efflux system)
MKIQVLLISAILLAVAGCKGDHPATEQSERMLQPVNVRVMTVAAGKTPLQTEIVGTVQPVDRADIAAKVTGTIEKMPVTLGSRVKAGDLLVKISAGEITARVIQAQTQLEQARRNLDRERKLLEKNAATPETVKSLEETFRVAESAYNEAKVMLSYTTLTAPFDGLITSKNANVGDLATPGTHLLQLENNRKLQVVTSVPEALVLQISPGDTLPVNIPAAGIDVHGKVAEIAPAADPASRTAEVKLDIEEALQLRSGQFARVALPGSDKDTLFVPESAVQVYGQMKKIFVVENKTAHLRLVRTGMEMDGQVEILSGLEPGETIVVRQGSPLVDGQPVVIEQ